MSNPDARRNVVLELKLQVSRAKFAKLHNEVESLLEIIKNHECDQPIDERAERCEEILNELLNEAPNLHA